MACPSAGSNGEKYYYIGSTNKNGKGYRLDVVKASSLSSAKSKVGSGRVITDHEQVSAREVREENIKFRNGVSRGATHSR